MLGKRIEEQPGTGPKLTAISTGESSRNDITTLADIATWFVRVKKTSIVNETD